MRYASTRWLVSLTCLALGPAVRGADPVDYATQIRPLFEKHCVSCHGPAKQKAGLRLDLGSRVLSGSVSGPVVVPKKSAESKLVQKLRGQGDGEAMPPDGELSDDDVRRIARWIDEGATVPKGEVDTSVRHWSYVKPVAAAVPVGAHPIDFLLDRERAKRGLTPAPPADRETLIRRVTFDLTGLPPTPQDVNAFRADVAPDAYERLVDRLLASPRYGERWGRHFLDVWRYSDWYGYGAELRNSQKHIWNWRDWVIESLNANKPYDRMVREMLAGDELAPGDPATVRATGYLARNYYKFNRNVWLDDIVEHTGKAFLGVTLNCARCHDHMYDPIAQTDYFRFRAIFEPHQVRLDPVPGEPDPDKRGIPRVYDADVAAATYLFERGDEKRPVKDKPLSPGLPGSIFPAPFAAKELRLAPDLAHPTLRAGVQKDLLDRAEKRVDAAKSPARVRAAVIDLQAVKAKLTADRARYAEPPAKGAPELTRHAVALHLEAAAAAAEADLADAEEALKKVETAAKKDTKAIEAQKKKVADLKPKVDAARKACETPPADYPPLLPSYPDRSSGRRLALADGIASKDHPLTARVLVNHVWLRHFGHPIVPTVFDFGKNGRPPSHPELLDHLAVELTRTDWDLKKLHRLLVTSRAYQMQSTLPGDAGAANRRADPDNLYVWRMNPRPLEAEAVRDSLIAVAGFLDETRGGPELDFNDDAAKLRRSVYYRHAPEKTMPFLSAFDVAGPTECYRRAVTVVPQQAMALVNSKLSHRAAEAVAKSLAGKPPAEFVAAAYSFVLNRPPSGPEAALCVDYLKANPPVSLVQALFNHADFTTIR